jgi:hypothetical protein
LVLPVPQENQLIEEMLDHQVHLEKVVLMEVQVKEVQLDHPDLK